MTDGLRPVLPKREHEVEPKDLRSSKTAKPDLFNLAHYPIRATCRICDQPVIAESQLSPFLHVNIGGK